MSSTSNSTANFTYDQAGTATVNYVTKAYGSSTNQTAYATQVNFENPGISGSGRKTFGNGTTYLSTLGPTTITNLFPFTDNYSVYAGTGGCTRRQHRAIDADHHSGVEPTISVTVPSINAIVATNTANPGNNGAGVLTSGGARVRATPSGTGCPAAFYLGTVSQSTIAGTGRFANPRRLRQLQPLRRLQLRHRPRPGLAQDDHLQERGDNGWAAGRHTAAAGTANLTATVYEFDEGSGQPDNGSTNGQCP